MRKSVILLLVMALAASGCQRRSRLTPWGSVVGDTAQTDSHLNMDEMLLQGELILLTLSAPDTYYEYHGRGMGLQFHLCQRFAASIGVSLRVELCRDSAEVFRRLRRGEGDIGISSDTIPTAVAQRAQLKATTIGNRLWFTYAGNDQLQDALAHWYNADELTFARQSEQTALLPQPRSYSFQAPVINRQRGIISRYDDLFRRYAPLAHTDWRLLAAQCCQESLFNPLAQSGAGAKGLMQLMPSTARQLGIGDKDIFDPATNIEGGARTMGLLLTQFGDIPSPEERLKFALAAYNGGYGHVRDAMRLAKKHRQDDRQWSNVAPFILRLMQPQYYQDPEVKHGYMRGEETVGYVDNVIRRYRIYQGTQHPSTNTQHSIQSPSYDDNSTPHRATNSHRFQL